MIFSLVLFALALGAPKRKLVKYLAPTESFSFNVQCENFDIKKCEKAKFIS